MYIMWIQCDQPCTETEHNGVIISFTRRHKTYIFNWDMLFEHTDKPKVWDL